VSTAIKLIECPRDAMQGMATYISVQKKADYINQLLKVGFDTIDFGSFVSPKAVPQMRDTAEVLSRLEIPKNKSKLLAIVGNERGAKQATAFQEINCLGYPLSVSETFQQRNTNSSIPDAIKRLVNIQDICVRQNKALVVYISMGFGNPYGDPYSIEKVSTFINMLKAMGVTTISIADTIGLASPEEIFQVFSQLLKDHRDIQIGAHLHSSPHALKNKLKAVLAAGCRRIDSAMLGYGGCPFAKDELVGNIPTETIVQVLQEQGFDTGLDLIAFEKSIKKASKIFIFS